MPYSKKQYTSHNRHQLKGLLHKAIDRKKNPKQKKQFKIGKPVDLEITSECSCAICMELLTAKNIAVTPCGHKYCFTCLMENITFSKKCPLCREKIAPDMPKKIIKDQDYSDIVETAAIELTESLKRLKDMEQNNDISFGDDDASESSETETESHDTDLAVDQLSPIANVDSIPDNESDDFEESSFTTDGSSDSSSVPDEAFFNAYHSGTGIIDVSDMRDLSRSISRSAEDLDLELSSREKTIAIICMSYVTDVANQLIDYYEK